MKRTILTSNAQWILPLDTLVKVHNVKKILKAGIENENQRERLENVVCVHF